jgi:hypothetical protein
LGKARAASDALYNKEHVVEGDDDGDLIPMIHDVSDDEAEGSSGGPRVVIDAHPLQRLLATYCTRKQVGHVQNRFGT